MKRYIKSTEDIMCMANLLGRDIRVPNPLPFSFYFSTKNSIHGIRVKPVFNPEKMSADLVGTLKLCDDWEYIPGKNDSAVDGKSIRRMKAFFRKYKVLFEAVWCKQLQETTVTDFFRGFITLKDLITQFEFYNDYKTELDEIDDIDELTEYIYEINVLDLS